MLTIFKNCLHKLIFVERPLKFSSLLCSKVEIWTDIDSAFKLVVLSFIKGLFLYPYHIIQDLFRAEIVLLFRVTDHKKQRKDKPAHKENEAIEFEFNIGVDDCAEIAMKMYKSEMLLSEDDAKKVNIDP